MAHTYTIFHYINFFLAPKGRYRRMAKTAGTKQQQRKKRD